MSNLIPVHISNKTFLTITLCGLTIKPSKADQLFETGNYARLTQLAKVLYPDTLTIKKVSGEQEAKASVDDIQTPPAATVEPVSIEVLDLSASVHNALTGAGVNTIEQLTQMTAKNVVDVKGIAKAGLQEIKDALAVLELSLFNEGVNDE